uniref:Intraflagellar transport protein 140 homolog n=1 Tax=Schistocephalus solidus TaxID=70667 RepID=A0A0X3PF54_SCHSO
MVCCAFLWQMFQGHIVRLSADLNCLARNFETTTERLSSIGHCGAPVIKILVDECYRLLLAITEDNMLIEFKISDEAGRTLSEIMRLKLASKLSNEPSFGWAGEMTLAMALGENVIRFWDISKSDNYTLTPSLPATGDQQTTVRITRIAYCPKFKLLAAGLSNGQIAIWRKVSNPKHPKATPIEAEQRSLCSNAGSLTAETGSAVFEPASHWHAQPIIDLISNHADENLRESSKVAVRLIAWDNVEGRLLAAYDTAENTDEACVVLEDETKFGVFILHQQALCVNLGGYGSAVVQISPQKMVVMSSDLRKLTKPSEPSIRSSLVGTTGSAALTANFAKPVDVTQNILAVEEQLRGCFCTKEFVSTWNGRQLRVYKHSIANGLEPFSSFACEFQLVGMYEGSIFTREAYKLQVRNFQGTVKQLINFSENEGEISAVCSCSGFMACLTDEGYLRTFDLTRREVKQLSGSKHYETFLAPFIPTAQATASSETPALRVRVTYLSVNASASLVALSLSSAAAAPATAVVRSESRRPAEAAESRYLITADEQLAWLPDPRLFVWQVETDRCQVFTFATGEQVRGQEACGADECKGTFRPSADGEGCDGEKKPVDGFSLSPAAGEFVRGRYPLRHYWDLCDTRLLVVEAAELPSEHPATGGDQDHTGTSADCDESFELRRPRSQISSLSECDVQISTNGKGFDYSTPGGPMKNVIVSFFVSQEQDRMIIQEYFFLGSHHTALIGLEVPYFYFAVRPDFAQALLNSQSSVLSAESSLESSKQKTDTGSSSAGSGDTGGEETLPQVSSASSQTPNLFHISRRVMRDFQGLESADASTKEAMLNFSFYLAQGEIDAAFKSMKLVRSAAIWQNMAKMCVSTRRLDVGLMCLGKMGNAFGAMMVREMQKREPNITVQTGELALQLGMTDEAERIFIECGRWDLVARLHQTLGHWEEAVQIAEKRNRVRLRNTHYAYAQDLRKQDRIDDAIAHYIKSNTHLVEVPRMLKDSPDQLEAFVKANPNKDLQRWWAQTLEAEGLLEEAEVYYSLANDYLSLVRVFCCLGREDSALALCNETGDRAACYHLARQLESKHNIDHAVHLFTRARAYSSAVRLCKEHNRNEHLFSLAQLGTPEDMLEAARHLEKLPGYEEKTIILYQRAGQLNTAIELAFKTRQYAALSQITCGVDRAIDPSLLSKCANFFMQNSQFEKAVELLASGKQYLEAIKLCGDYGVNLTEELVEKLTPPPDLPSEERVEILTQLGYQCITQNQYHLACKKFTQAGDHVAGMKALLRSGDTEKIIFFANVSKKRDIYLMAANYLQTLDVWRTDTEIVRTIVLFYTRAKALESLASFYEACAQVEIEDCQNYEKAMGALTEAYKALSKAAAVSADTVNMNIDSRLQQRLLGVKMKIMLCKQFVETQMMFEEDPVEALSRCQALLEEPDTAKIIRPGDIYATMIRELVAKEKFQAAYACMQDMKERLKGKADVTAYLDRATQLSILRALDMPIASHEVNKPTSHEESTSDVDSVEENVVDLGITGSDED